jgi:hypothetical protein
MERGVWGERLKKSFHFKYIQNSFEYERTAYLSQIES